MRNIALAFVVAAACLANNPASAASYVSYNMIFNGVYGHLDSSTGFKAVEQPAFGSVIFNLPDAVDSSNANFSQVASNGLGGFPTGSYSVEYGNPSSIHLTGIGLSGSQASLDVYLGPANNGGLSNFTNAGGTYAFINHDGPSEQYFYGSLLFLFTNFSELPVSGPNIVSKFSLVVPEPNSWTTFIGGFAIIGLMMRRKRLVRAVT